MKVFILSLLSFTLTFTSVCKCAANQYQYKISSGDTADINVNNILQKVNTAVSSIRSGEYKLHDRYTMLNVGEDTTIRKENISSHVYKVVANDSLMPYKVAWHTDNYEEIYNGKVLYTNAYKTLTITDVARFPGPIKRMRGNLSAMPFMQEANAMMQNYKTYHRPVAFTGYDFVEGEKCFKVQAGNATDDSYVQYYISTTSYLPVKSTVILTHINNKAKRVQTFNDWVTDIKINNDIGDERFEKGALSAYNKEVQFTGSDNEPAKLLPVGSAAPGWELPALNNKIIKLSDMAGKIVVMDFWYKACTPCQQQMIDLETLYAKYDKSKVVFIGVNTIDDPIKDKLKLFLSNRKIRMPTVYNGKKIESLYHSYTSPILYIIKDGKILYIQDGFSQNMIKDVNKVIEQNL